MDERFVPLAAFLRGPSALAPTVAASHVRPDPLPEPAEAGPRSADEFVQTGALQELTLMRLAAREAFERGKDLLLASLAERVLGRELALAPAVLDALVAEVVAASRELDPVSLVLSAADAERVRTPLRTRIDAALAPGDFIVEVRDGALASPMGFRLQTALERASLGET